MTISEAEAMQLSGLALLSTDQMRRADGIAIAAGTAGIALMERAGSAVAEATLRRVGKGARVAIACGPGNNGGDGFVAARLLHAHGVTVQVALLGSPDALRGDAALAFAQWSGPVLPLASLADGAIDLYVDALFGAGLARPLAGEAAEAVTLMNGAGRPVISVDIPSGVSGDTGQAEGPAVRATETVTFFRLKPGHLLLPGRSLCGEIVVADIGVPAAAALSEIAPAAFRNEPALWLAAVPHHGLDTHKFRRGAVAVAAGGIAGVGAPRLSARAALRIGAGLVTILCAPGALAAHASRGPDAVMQRPVAGGEALAEFLQDRRISAIVAGPALGLDERAAALVRSALASDRPVVLDADALTLLATSLREEASPPNPAHPRVFTPHEGEFQRLFGKEPAIATEASKLERARKAAARSGAILVYKGADTVIAAPDGRAAINATGSPALATAGSGDVLAGLIAGLLAQGMSAFEAACAAVWLHGRAGEALGMGLIADDLPEAIPPLLRNLSVG